MKRKINWLLFFFCAVSFCIANFSIFFKGMHSDSHRYYIFGGDLEWWVTFLDYKIQIVWLIIFAVVLGARKKRLSIKQSLQLLAFFSTYAKDICDWVQNNNHGTKITDWTITIIALLLIEFLTDWAVRIIRKYINPLFHFTEEKRNSL